MNQSEPIRSPSIAGKQQYRWTVVGILWFCGFFNYADRQALSSVLTPIKEEFALDDLQLGLLGSSFMVVYAIMSPFAGYVVDHVSRRVLIPIGLGVWSLIAAATGLARSFGQLLFLRAAEGFGESFYFPASLSLIADYHGKETRSRAMGIHQTSVYIGTAGGAAIAGLLAEHYGWRTPFLVLGLAGAAYALGLGFLLIEPPRGQSEQHQPKPQTPFPPEELLEVNPPSADPFWEKVVRILSNRAALLLLCVFIGANFVATAFLIWLQTFIHRGFGTGVGASALLSAVWPMASLFGALLGGMLADHFAMKGGGGRIRVQGMGLILGAPFVFLTGWTNSISLLVIGLILAGFCKGIYDANIFSSLFDVIALEDRGTAAGLMNSLGWTGGFLAPIAVGYASKQFGLSVPIASTALVYLLVGSLALYAGRLADRKARGVAVE